MSDYFLTTRISEKQWSTAALMTIASIPSENPEAIFRQLITLSDSLSTSMELIITSNKESERKLDIMLLVKIKGNSPVNLVDELTLMTDNMLHLLTYAGFFVKLLTSDQIRLLDKEFNDRRNTVLVFPGENSQGSESFYLPGRYDAVREIDFRYLATVISECDNAGLSFQINRSVLFPEEINGIIARMEWLSSLQTKEAKYELDLFSRYIALQNEPNFFVCVTVWGDRLALDRLMISLKDCGYSAVSVPAASLFDKSYVAVGDLILQSHATLHGHAVKTRAAIPFGCDRLNYLTDCKGIIKILSRLNELTPFSNTTRHNISEINIQEIPGVLINGNGIALGNILGTDRTISVPENYLVKHAVITGMPGCGKTSLIFYILNELYKKKIPFIAVEPVKTEYREMMEVIPDLKVYTPGRTDVAPFMFNPFLPPKGVTLEQFLPSLVEAFSTVLSLTTPLDAILPEALKNCYSEYGWTNTSTIDSQEITVFGMHEFIEAFKREALRSNYDSDSKQNLLSGGVYRLQNILNTNSYLFDTDVSLSFEELMNGYSVIELDAIDNPEHKALIMCLLMMQIKLVIRHNQKKDSTLKNVLLLDEAHVLLGGSDYSVKKNEANPVGGIKEIFIDLVKISRAYGTGLVFSDQSLSILEEFVSNADIKITMHMENAAEREFLARNLGYTAEVYNNIRNLSVGQFYLSCGKLSSPVLAIAPDSRTVLSIPEDLSDDIVASKMKVHHRRPFAVCKCRNDCDISIRALGETLARRLMNQMDSENLNDKAGLENYMKRNLSDALGPMVEGYDEEKKLLRCAEMQFRRMIAQKISF